MRFKVHVGVGILFLFAGGAKGQFLQFNPPGGPDARPETVQERLEREIRQAPFHLGPVRIAPLVGFRDVAYVQDLFETGQEDRTDVTATVGAGFRAYLHTGRKVTWIAQILPEYVWWNEREEARRLNLSGGLGAVLLFNRLTVDMAASRVEAQRIVTPEIPELVNTANDLGRLDAELELSDQLRPFVSARLSREEGLVEDREDDPRVQQIQLLDRNERILRAGLHWYPRTDWMIGLGAERSEVDFVEAALDSSNEGTSPVFELRIDRPHVYVSADLAWRALEPVEGSRFVEYDEVTGSAALSVLPRSRVEVTAYAHRELLYSVSPDYPYLQDQRLGLSSGVGFGERLFLRIFAETGSNDYTASSPTASRREDDLISYGGSLSFALTDLLSLAFQVTRLDLDSNLPGSDRTYTSGGLSIALRGNLAGKNL